MKDFLDAKFDELVQTYYVSLADWKFERVKNYLNSISSEELYDALNLLKASIVSGLKFTDYYDGVKNINTTSDSDILDICLVYMAETHQLETRTYSNKRDIVAEVASVKFGVSQEGVTEDMRNELLFNPGDVYSITDLPLKNWDEYFF